MNDGEEQSKALQAERFKEAARALECDENEVVFDEKLKGIARPRAKEPADKPAK